MHCSTRKANTKQRANYSADLKDDSGAEYACATRLNARQQQSPNSLGPLSATLAVGYPRRAANIFRRAMTLRPVGLRPTSIAKHSRVPVTATVNKRKRRPSASASLTKSKPAPRFLRRRPHSDRLPAGRGDGRASCSQHGFLDAAACASVSSKIVGGVGPARVTLAPPLRSAPRWSG